MAGSSAYAFNEQVGATDNAIGLSANTGTAVAKDQGIALAQGATLKTGVELGNVSGGSTITIGDLTAAKTFADAILAVTEKNNAALSDALQNSARANIPSPADVPAADGTTKPDPNAADATPTNWWLWGSIAAGLAGLAYLAMRR